MCVWYMHISRLWYVCLCGMSVEYVCLWCVCHILCCVWLCSMSVVHLCGGGRGRESKHVQRSRGIYRCLALPLSTSFPGNRISHWIWNTISARVALVLQQRGSRDMGSWPHIYVVERNSNWGVHACSVGTFSQEATSPVPKFGRCILVYFICCVHTHTEQMRTRGPGYQLWLY